MVVDFLDANLTGVRQWQDALLEQAKKGYITVPHFNYQIHFDVITHTVLKDLPKVAVNYTNQGLCSMIMSRAAMLAQERVKRFGAHVVVMVHDSFIVEAPKGTENQVGKIMLESLRTAGNEFTDLIPWQGELELGDNWADMKEMKLESE
jgi:DNA polymerase I-like protein with 3'-5' exonuclease and polymerase domains